MIDDLKKSEEMGQPNSEPSKGLVGVGRPILKNLKGVRASNGRLSVGGEQEGNLFGSHLGSLRLAVNPS